MQPKQPKLNLHHILPSRPSLISVSIKSAHASLFQHYTSTTARHPAHNLQASLNPTTMPRHFPSWSTLPLLSLLYSPLCSPLPTSLSTRQSTSYYGSNTIHVLDYSTHAVLGCLNAIGQFNIDSNCAIFTAVDGPPASAFESTEGLCTFATDAYAYTCSDAPALNLAGSTFEVSNLGTRTW